MFGTPPVGNEPPTPVVGGGLPKPPIDGGGVKVLPGPTCVPPAPGVWKPEEPAPVTGGGDVTPVEPPLPGGGWVYAPPEDIAPLPGARFMSVGPPGELFALDEHPASKVSAHSSDGRTRSD